VPKSSLVIVDRNGWEENLQLNLGRTKNALSLEMESQMIVNANEPHRCLISFTGNEFLKLACD
jgi:hypothetical protein